MKKDAPSKTKRIDKKRVIGFQVVEEECIWMKAGVINFRMCDNAYDCQNCPFDVGMRKAMAQEPTHRKKEKQPAWVDQLRKRFHGASRPCRHALLGRVDVPKICTWNYECYHCPYDQMLDDFDVTQLSEAPKIFNVAGYYMADDYYYHMGHSWARFEHGGFVRVGMDDFIHRVLGAASELSLPPLGAEVSQNEVGWSLTRDGHNAAVLSPVKGKVLAVNHKVQEHPQIAHADPYHSGWLFIVEPDLPRRNLKGLYLGKESFQWIEQESRILLDLMGPEYRDLAATGGEAIDDVFGRFPDLGWNVLTSTFLRTENL